MRPTLVLLTGMLVLGVGLMGCSKSDDDGDAVKPQVSLNPSGKPRDEKEAAQATAQTQMGQSANSEMAKQAKAMAEAQAKSGGR